MSWMKDAPLQINKVGWLRPLNHAAQNGRWLKSKLVESLDNKFFCHLSHWQFEFVYDWNGIVWVAICCFYGHPLLLLFFRVLIDEQLLKRKTESRQLWNSNYFAGPSTPLPRPISFKKYNVIETGAELRKTQIQQLQNYFFSSDVAGHFRIRFQ